MLCGCSEQSEIDMPNSIKILLNQNNINNTYICKIGDYSKCKLTQINEKDIQVSKEEIRKYSEIQMESYAKIVPVEGKNTVEKEDVVYISCLVYQNGKLIREVKDDSIMVGKYNYDEQIEKALIGQKIGIPFSLYVEYQDIGKCKLNITVESINRFITYDLTDEFVKEKFGVNSIEAYYAQCEDFVRQQKVAEQKSKAQKELFLKIGEMCKFNINKDEIAKYSKKYVESEEKIAMAYDMTLELYAKEVLGKTIEEFYQECYQVGENEIKQYLIVGAIFQKSNMVITDDEYKSKCSEMEYEIETVEENEQLDALVRYNIMKEKVLEMY